jgi:hypothetical protein
MEGTHQASDRVVRFVYYDPRYAVLFAERVEGPLVLGVVEPFGADVE